MRALVPLCMRAVCSKIGRWYCFPEHNRRTISRLDTRRSASKDSLERGKSRQKHIGQQPTQCKRLSDHPIKTGGIGTIQFYRESARTTSNSPKSSSLADFIPAKFSKAKMASS